VANFSTQGRVCARVSLPVGVACCRLIPTGVEAGRLVRRVRLRVVRRARSCRELLRVGVLRARRIGLCRYLGENFIVLGL
jgi:hypothetical protein